MTTPGLRGAPWSHSCPGGDGAGAGGQPGGLTRGWLSGRQSSVPAVTVVAPEDGVGEHGEREGGAYRVVNPHEDEPEQHHELAGQSVRGYVPPVPPGAVQEEADVQSGPGHTGGDQQELSLPVAADGLLAAAGAAGGPAEGDGLGAALLMSG